MFVSALNAGPGWAHRHAADRSGAATVTISTAAAQRRLGCTRGRPLQPAPICERIASAWISPLSQVHRRAEDPWRIASHQVRLLAHRPGCSPRRLDDSSDDRMSVTPLSSASSPPACPAQQSIRTLRRRDRRPPRSSPVDRGRRVAQASAQIFRLQLRIVVEDRLGRLARRRAGPAPAPPRCAARARSACPRKWPGRP